jgi:hypothetical protein
MSSHQSAYNVLADGMRHAMSYTRISDPKRANQILRLLGIEEAEVSGPLRRRPGGRPKPGALLQKLRQRRMAQSQQNAPVEAEEGESESAEMGRRVPVAPPVKPMNAPGQLVPEWSAETEVSHNLRLRTRRGTRAAIVPLRPGMHLVFEVAQELVHPVFGLDPMTATLAVHAANAILSNPAALQQAGRTVQQVAQQAAHHLYGSNNAAPVQPMHWQGVAVGGLPWLQTQRVPSVYEIENTELEFGRCPNQNCGCGCSYQH